MLHPPDNTAINCGIPQQTGTCTRPPHPEDGAGLYLLGGDLVGYALLALAAAASAAPPEIVDVMFEGLARSSRIAAFPIATAAPRLAFPDGPPDALPEFAERTPVQQQFVGVLAELGPETHVHSRITERVRKSVSISHGDPLGLAPPLFPRVPVLRLGTGYCFIAPP